MVVELTRPTGRKSPRRPGMPECMRLAAVSDQSQPIGEFLEWLATQGFELARWNEDDRLYPAPDSTEKLLARYFDIDLNRVERERGRLLAWLRKRGDA